MKGLIQYFREKKLDPVVRQLLKRLEDPPSPEQEPLGRVRTLATIRRNIVSELDAVKQQQALGMSPGLTLMYLPLITPLDPIATVLSVVIGMGVTVMQGLKVSSVSDTQRTLNREIDKLACAILDTPQKEENKSTFLLEQRRSRFNSVIGPNQEKKFEQLVERGQLPTLLQTPLQVSKPFGFKKSPPLIAVVRRPYDVRTESHQSVFGFMAVAARPRP